MNLIIKPLTPELIPDYLNFFDNRAFTDENPNGPCYCNVPIMTTEEINKMVSEFGNDCKGILRKYAAVQLNEGKIKGYLAFDGNISIGWCNAADMDSYIINSSRFIPDFARESRCGKTISVLCFEIAPEYRCMGIASAFLSRICEDAKAMGYAAVEGYAQVQKERIYYDFTGPVRLFEKAGFKEAARQDDRIIMRKML